ncbi:hypothetical protein Fmac_002941 [Flemingia macrophylla]|uniref:Glycosyltransferase 2-like domain-containing protein n=1 Tax=Flemingia macrophylla TaxID=520843 RepID=A0ABD1NLC6_9FABA
MTRGMTCTGEKFEDEDEDVIMGTRSWACKTGLAHPGLVGPTACPMKRGHAVVAASLGWFVVTQHMQELVQLECQRWASKGVNIKYGVRDNKNGYKARTLKKGMKRSYMKQCDCVAIFDADFQLEPNFL